MSESFCVLFAFGSCFVSTTIRSPTARSLSLCHLLASCILASQSHLQYFEGDILLKSEKLFESGQNSST